MRTKDEFIKLYSAGKKKLEMVGIVNPSIACIEANANVSIILTDENKQLFKSDYENGYIKQWVSGRGGRMIVHVELTKKGKKEIEKYIV